MVPEPAGFKMDHYRDPVPDGLAGATVMHTPELARYISAAHPILIDVLPAPVPPPDARPDLPRLPLPHRDVPGSLWWPDVGRGALSPALEARFKSELVEATHGQRTAPVVFYCLSQCWMSWNAAKRAVLYGYRHVIWYPDGADGWMARGYASVIAEPAR